MQRVNQHTATIVHSAFLHVYTAAMHYMGKRFDFMVLMDSCACWVQKLKFQDVLGVLPCVGALPLLFAFAPKPSPGLMRRLVSKPLLKKAGANLK